MLVASHSACLLGVDGVGAKILAAADEGLIELDLNASRRWIPPGEPVGLIVEGEAIGRDATVYIRVTQSYARTAEVAIHEGIHALGVGGSVRAEALARIAELMHRGEAVTFSAMRNILRDIRSVPSYSGLPARVGRTSPHFPEIAF